MLICNGCRKEIHPNSKVVTSHDRIGSENILTYYHRTCIPYRMGRAILRELSRLSNAEHNVRHAYRRK